jgi:hypothetical protein
VSVSGVAGMLLTPAKRRPPDLVACAGDERAGRVERPRNPPGLRRDDDAAGGPVVDVRLRDPGAGDLVQEESRSAQVERIEQAPPHLFLVRAARHHLDQPPGQGQRGVVVAEHPAGRGELRETVHCGDVAGERPGVVAGVEVEVAEPAGRVVERLPDGHPRRGRSVSGPEAGNVAADRTIKIDLALLHETHDGRAGEGLGGRADAEDRVGVHVLGSVGAGDAEATDMFVSAIPQAEADAGDAIPLHPGLDLLLELPNGGRDPSGPWRCGHGGDESTGRGGAQEVATGQLLWWHENPRGRGRAFKMHGTSGRGSRTRAPRP